MSYQLSDVRLAEVKAQLSRVGGLSPAGALDIARELRARLTVQEWHTVKRWAQAALVAEREAAAPPRAGGRR